MNSELGLRAVVGIIFSQQRRTDATHRAAGGTGPRTRAVGLAPLLQATRFDVLAALRRGGAATMLPSGRRWRAGLVVAQFALALVVATAAGLLYKNIRRFDAIDLGFDRRNLATVLDPATRPALWRSR